MSKAENKLAEELARQIVHHVVNNQPDDINEPEWKALTLQVAALLEPHLVGEWLPIESAPHMRTVILWADTSFNGTSNWRMGSGHFHEGIGAWIWEGEQVKEGWAHPPTHWQPLPAPPKGEQS